MNNIKKFFLYFMIMLSGAGIATEIIKVSSFNPSKSNATIAAQKALDSGAKKIIFDDIGYPYLVEPLFIRSNSEVIINDNVIIQARSGAFHGSNDCLFTMINEENITLRGVGKAMLMMNKKDYADLKQYKHSEWRHSVSIRSSHNVTVRDLLIKGSGGDGVYVSVSKQDPVASCNVLLENLTIEDHYRQGISVIGAKNLTIRKCRISNTRGTPPMAGIDFEPNNHVQILENCIVENCDFVNNSAAGVFVCCGKLDAPIDITLRNCRFTGNGIGLDLDADRNTLKPNRGKINVEKCVISNSPVLLYLRNARGNVNYNFSDCVIDNKLGKSKSAIRVFTMHPEDCRGINFGNLLIRQNKKIHPITFHSSSGAGFTIPSGSITTEDKNGKRTVVDLNKFAAANKPDLMLKQFKTLPLDMRGYVPAKKIGCSVNGYKIRSKMLDFVQYADGKTPIKLTFITTWKNKKARAPKLPVQIFDPAGTPYGNFYITSEKFEYTFSPSREGVYRFQVNTSVQRALNIQSSAPGFGFSGSTRLKSIYGKGVKFYFVVPFGVRDIALEIYGDPPLEAVEAKLIDPAGGVRSKVPFKVGAQVLFASRSDVSKTEVWCVSVPRVVEDWAIRLGTPLPPVLYTHPDNVLVLKK